MRAAPHTALPRCAMEQGAALALIVSCTAKIRITPVCAKRLGGFSRVRVREFSRRRRACARPAAKATHGASARARETRASPPVSARRRQIPRFCPFFCPVRAFLPSGGQLYACASENAARGRRKSLAPFSLALAPFFLALAPFFRGVHFPGAMCRPWSVSKPRHAFPPSVCPPVPRLRPSPYARSGCGRVPCVRPRVRSRLRPLPVSARVPGRVSVRVRSYGYARALGDGCAPVSACARVLHIRAGASRADFGRHGRHKKAAQPAQKRACAGLCAAPFALALKRLARV